jgi:hypothetical protein
LRQLGAGPATNSCTAEIPVGGLEALVRDSSKVGTTVGILGQGFEGTTAVSFNGIRANFTVRSETFLRATVPVGATTGFITVTTPSGALTSNLAFHLTGRL